MFEAASGQKRFYVIKGAPHNGPDYYDPERYYEAMAAFFAEFDLMEGNTTGIY